MPERAQLQESLVAVAPPPAATVTTHVSALTNNAAVAAVSTETSARSAHSVQLTTAPADAGAIVVAASIRGSGTVR